MTEYFLFGKSISSLHFLNPDLHSGFLLVVIHPAAIVGSNDAAVPTKSPHILLNPPVNPTADRFRIHVKAPLGKLHGNILRLFALYADR